MIYDLENNRLVVNWPEPKKEAYEQNSVGLQQYRHDLAAYNNRPFVKCSPETPKLWAGRNGEEIPEGEYEVRYYMAFNFDWLCISKDGYDRGNDEFKSTCKILAYPVTKEGRYFPDDLLDQVRKHIKADNLFDWHEALTENEMEYLENLMLTFCPLFPPGSMGQKKQDEHAKKLSQPASQQPSGEGLEDSRAVDEKEMWADVNDMSNLIDNYDEWLIKVTEKYTIISKSHSLADDADDNKLKHFEGEFAAWASEEGWAKHIGIDCWSKSFSSEYTPQYTTADLFTQFLNETGKETKK
jgi:hypothetical protein